MKAKFALVGEVVLPGGLLRRAAVVIEGGVISEVIEDPLRGDLPKDSREVSIICPGFVDLQINGAFGVNVEANPQSLTTLARRLPGTGTTSFLPSLISSPAERYAGFLQALEEASQRNSGARILGAHLEGPFLSPVRRGAHDSKNLRPVDLGLVRELLETGLVRVMTIAPELPGAEEAAGLLRGAGAVASIGHTDATYEEVVSAVDVGFTMATHLYNGMSPLMHRAPGAVGAVLDENRIRTSVIADGVHVHGGALRVAYRQKGADGLSLVTDAMEAAGMPPGEYDLSGRRVRLEDGAVRLPDGTLAGSTLTMDGAVRNAVELVGIPLQTAVRMASETPADILGMPEKGRISPGADADLVVLSPTGVVLETIVGGQTVYARRNDAQTP